MSDIPKFERSPYPLRLVVGLFGSEREHGGDFINCYADKYVEAL